MVEGRPSLELCFGTVRDADLPSMVVAAHRAGFGSVTVTPRMLERALAAGWSTGSLRALLEDHGLRVGYIEGHSALFPGSAPPPSDLVGSGRQESFLDTAEALGSAAIAVVYLYGGLPVTGDMANPLSQFCGLAAERGLEVLVESLPGTPIPDPASALALIEESEARNAKVTLDTLAFCRSGGTVDDLAPAILAGLGAIQVSDWDTQVEEKWPMPRERLLPGEGNLPLGQILARVCGARPSLAVGVEVFSSRLRSLPTDEAALLAADSMRAVLAATE